MKLARVLHATNTVVEEVPLWYLLLFGEYTDARAYVHFAFTIILMLFNILRLHVTLEVGVLRDREDYFIATGIRRSRPNLKGTEKRTMSKDIVEVPHPLIERANLVAKLYYVAICYACWEGLRVLFEQVPLIRAIDLAPRI